MSDNSFDIDAYDRLCEEWSQDWVLTKGDHTNDTLYLNVFHYESFPSSINQYINGYGTKVVYLPLQLEGWKIQPKYFIL